MIAPIGRMSAIKEPEPAIVPKQWLRGRFIAATLVRPADLLRRHPETLGLSYENTASQTAGRRAAV